MIFWGGAPRGGLSLSLCGWRVLKSGIIWPFSSPLYQRYFFVCVYGFFCLSSLVYLQLSTKEKWRALRALPYYSSLRFRLSFTSPACAVFLRTNPKRHPRAVVRPLRSRCNISPGTASMTAFWRGWGGIKVVDLIPKCFFECAGWCYFRPFEVGNQGSIWVHRTYGEDGEKDSRYAP